MTGVRVQVADYRTPLQSLPLLVQLGLTYRCNLRCAHCYAVERRSRTEMPAERLALLANELYEAGAVAVVYSHGENLLRRDFHRIAGAFRDLGFHQTLMSNGFFIRTPSAARTLMNAGVARCMISVDSSVPRAHDAVRGRPGAHATALRAVDLLVAAGMPTVGFSTAIGPHNYHDMRSIIDLAVDRGCTAISLMQHRATMRQTHESKDRFDYRQICTAAYELILRYREKIDVYTHDPFMLTLLDDRLDGDAARADYIGANLCNVGTSMVSIDPTGAVLACNFLPTVYGSVLKEPFAEIWARLVHLTGGIDHRRHGACGSCELANLCGGGCLAHREAMSDGTLCPYPGAPAACA